ncbi:MAG: TonB family protein [Enterobacterales bacterium]|jgi:TonB family protein
MMKMLLLIFCLLTTLDSHADLNSTLDKYSSGDYSSAYQEFLSMAKMGEKDSQFNLGVMYYHGQHIEKDINKAYAWMKLATQSDNSRPKLEKLFQSVALTIEDKTQAEAEYKQLDSLYSTDTLLYELYPVFVEPKGENAFEAIPKTIVEPKWPRKALNRGIQGYVRVQFDVDKTGAPRNIEMITAIPEKIFNKTSLDAVQKWRFKVNQDNSDESNKQLHYTMEFRLEGLDAPTINDKLYTQTELAAYKGDAIAQFKIGYWDKTLKQSRSNINPNEWFLKSAIQGHPSAQYEIGVNLVRGRGCIIDKTKGLDWLIRSAASGERRAKHLLASIASKMSDIDSHRRAIQLYSEVVKLTNSARLDYAWLLATTPFVELSNPTKAIELSEEFSSKTFRDDATLYEIKAASYAAMGNFKKAISYQKDALDEAEDMGADLTDIEDHLESYRSNKKWF